MLTSPFFTFAFVFVIAFLMPFIALSVPAFRMPTAILEILCGVLVGRSGLHVILPPDWLHVITKLGLLYLMFLAGLEIRTQSPDGQANTGNKREQVILALAHFVATMAVALAAGHLLQMFGMSTSPLFTALMFATTSLGVVVPILKESGWMDRPLGQTLLLSALFADFGTVALVPFTLNVPGLSTGHPLFAIVALTVLGILLYFGGKKVLQAPVLAKRSARTQQLGVRGALALMGISGAISQAFGGGMILGGFVSGFVCSLLAKAEHEVLRKKLEILGYSLFLPLFFITVGMDLDVSHIAFGQLLSWLPAYLLLAFLVKGVASLTLWPCYKGRELSAAGALLSTRFTLVIAVALTAAKSHIISGTEEGTLIAMALGTVLLSPMLFLALLPQKQDA
ncbi:MAG: cation:proton antiporter [Firmicutes bacterium]|nr:cation:proton antiporter [Bacillota bacterium]